MLILLASELSQKRKGTLMTKANREPGRRHLGGEQEGSW